MTVRPAYRQPTETVNEAGQRGARWPGPLRMLAALLLLMILPLREVLQLNSLKDSDVWLHLRTGLWILEHHGVPHTGLFSQFPNATWVDSNWAYQFLIALSYQGVGLRALPMLRILLLAMIGLGTFALAGGLRKSFLWAIPIAMAAQYALSAMAGDLVLCSAVFFCGVLYILMEARSRGQVRVLYLLPALFFVWSNVHLGFLGGLAAVVLFGGTIMGERLLPGKPAATTSKLPPGVVTAVVVACFAATLLTPNVFSLYSSVSEFLDSSFVWSFQQGTHSMAFRRPEDYAVLLMALGAFFSLGLRRSRDPFQYLLLTASAGLALAMRDNSWLSVVASVAVMGDLGRRGTQEGESRAGLWITATAACAGLIVVTALLVPSTAMLRQKISGNFPVQACDFIQQNHLPGNLVNSYRWGGFLIWYLPQYPVAADSRAAIYGDEWNEEYVKILHGRSSIATSSVLAQSQIFLLGRKDDLARDLSANPAYHLVYQDSQSTIYVRR